jgi:hypothetical protein
MAYTGFSQEISDMPTEKRPGKKGVYVELPEDLDAEFRAFVESFPVGGIAQHVQWAIRRHMDTPPTIAAASPVKPMSVPAEPPAKPKKGRGKKA